MRLLIPLFIWFAAAVSGVAQTSARPVVIDPRLYAAFEPDYLERLRQEQPTLLLRCNFYLDNAFTISDYPPEKGALTQFPEVTITDPARVNIFVVEKEQALARDWERPMFYRIAGTQKVLMYWPGQDFNRRFRAWLEQP